MEISVEKKKDSEKGSLECLIQKRIQFQRLKSVKDSVTESLLNCSIREKGLFEKDPKIQFKKIPKIQTQSVRVKRKNTLEKVSQEHNSVQSKKQNG